MLFRSVFQPFAMLERAHKNGVVFGYILFVAKVKVKVGKLAYANWLALFCCFYFNISFNYAVLSLTVVPYFFVFHSILSFR